MAGYQQRNNDKGDDPMSLFDLSGNVAIITGSTKGIGKAIATNMAMAGAKVVVSSRKADVCEAVAAQINKEHARNGGEAISIPCHVGQADQLRNLVDRTLHKWGKIDTLVPNAASNPYHGPSSGLPDSAFEKILDTNVRSVHRLCHMVLPHMVERKSGSITIIASIAGLKGVKDLGAYAISKVAEHQIARNLAVEYGPDNIRVNAIAPGLIKTDFAQSLVDRSGSAREGFIDPAASPYRRSQRNRGCGNVSLPAPRRVM